MKGLILKYCDKEYRFVLETINDDIPTNTVMVTFRMHNEDISNKTYTLNLRKLMALDLTNVAEYYRELCIAINIDPSVVPDIMEI